MGWFFADAPVRTLSPTERVVKDFGVDIHDPREVAVNAFKVLAAKMSRSERSVVAATILHDKALGLALVDGAPLPDNAGVFVCEFTVWLSGLSAAQRASFKAMMRDYPAEAVEALSRAYAESLRGCDWGY